MNISVTPRTVKTADGHIPRSGDQLYHLNHTMNGCKITKFICKYWSNNHRVYGEVLFYDDPSRKTREWVTFRNGPVFFPSKETNPNSGINWTQVYFSFDNAVAAYRKRLNQMSKIKLSEKNCKTKFTTYED